jgi:hypothetical protein
MSFRFGRKVALAAIVAAVGAMSLASAPASALNLKFTNWAVWGSLTDKKTGEPTVLPKGSTFNGEAELSTLTETEVSGTITGKLFVPPFKAKIKLEGLVPSEVGVTLTQVGHSEGTIVTAPPADCARDLFKGLCETTTVTSKTILGITAAGYEGIEIPTECQTTEPITLTLSDTVPLNTPTERFKGTTTIPSFTCSGLSGVLLGPALTELESGPENPYSIKLSAHEPSAPFVETEPATLVTQISAKLKGHVSEEGEEVTSCKFEYGTEETYGKSVPCFEPPGSGTEKSAQLTGLSEGTTYHYRTVATNALGTTDGADKTFTTLPAAGSPEYGQCVAQKKGEYTDAGCTDKSPKAQKGKFEWKPGPAPTCVAQKRGEYTNASCTTKSAKAKKGTFEKAPGPGYTSTSGTVTLETQELASTVVCASSTGAGEVTGPKAGVDRITLSGCEESGKKCTSEGANSTPSGKAGVIVSNLLATRPLGPVEGSEVWTHLASSEHEPYAAEFGCEGALFRVEGDLSGQQAENIGVMTTASTTTFKLTTVFKGESEQALQTERSENGGSTWSAAEPSTLVMTVSNTSASATDIKI